MSSERKPPDDRELDDFLAGRHPVGRAYREVSDEETAPRELDDAILRMAREHAAATPPRRRPRWLQPLAVAATLALSLGVLMNIWRDPVLREQAAPTGDERTVPSEPEAAVPPAPIEEQKVEAPPPFNQTDAFKKFGPPPEPAKPDPAPESRRAAQPFPRDGAPKLAEDRERTSSSLSDSVSPSTTSPRADAAIAPTAPSPPPPPALGAAAPVAPAASGGVPSRPDIDPRRAEPERDADGSFSKEGRESQTEIQAMPAAPAMREQEARALAKEKSAVQKSMADDAAAAGASASRSEEPPPSRDVLIERARAALKRGDAEEARRQVAELRRLYPDAALPDDLRSMAGSPP
jgi:hypothetical protein